MSVQRWDLSGEEGSYMKSSDNGDYVESSDYFALDTKYSHAMKEIGRMKLAYAKLREELERERAKNKPRASIP